MTVYVIGPMTSRPHYNVVAFETAVAQWTLGGWTVKTPLDADSIIWRKHYGRDFDPRTDKCDYGDPLLREMVVEGIGMMLGCDGVAVLPGWEKSAGTIPEVLIARNALLPLYDAPSMFRINPTLRVLVA